MGVKIHLAEEHGGWPAVGVIAQLGLPTATGGVGDGSVEPALSLNFDKRLPHGFALEWNAVVTAGAEGDGEVNGALLWAAGREVSPGAELFAHGQIAVPLRGGGGMEAAAGPGLFWALGDRIGLDSSVLVGLKGAVPRWTWRLIGVTLVF